ncbi:MAG TPA: hypothetical protein VFN49_05530 [Candidatus Aquilonibacter sp.]|nr:hypothetical protein [Candidatus Aquilonibacter sp.]
MGTTWGPDRLLYRAIVMSLALHLVIALFFPALASFRGNGPSIETISFVRAIHISVLPARRVAQQHPAVAIQRAPVAAVVIPPRRVGARTVHTKLVEHGRESHAPLVGVVQQKGSTLAAPVDASAAPAAVAATPAPATVASSETRSQTGGYMPLGAEEHDPVLDPAVERALAALGVHTTLIVVVGADGKTTTVSFNPALSDALEAQIRAMLSDARWDPAVCGAGITCDGKTTIKL